MRVIYGITETAEVVRCLRDAAGLSQAKLGALVGTSAHYIARLEGPNSSRPSWDMLAKIAEACDMHLRLDGRTVEVHYVVRSGRAK